MIPYTMNSLSLGLTNKSGSAENLGMSQAGVADLLADTIAIAEAPSDGKTYVRQNGAWVAVAAVEEAPSDGKTYVRQNGAWVAVTIA